MWRLNFLKFESAGIPIRPFKYLSEPILIIAHAPCMRMCDAHAHRDITRFAYDVNHVTMMSPVFVFHSCHVEIRWHDCSCCRNTTSSWFASHGDGVGMPSLCSHCVLIVLMTSSHSDHDVIMTHVNHDCSHGSQQTDSLHDRQTICA